MNLFVENQLLIFSFACALGVLLSLVYDMIRIIRRIVKHSRSIVGIEDILFFICASLIIFKYTLETNDGMMRGFIFVGIAIGSTLYFLLFSSLIIKYITKSIKGILNGIKICILAILKPFGILFKPINFVSKKTKKSLKKSSKWLIIKFKKCMKEIYFIVKKI